MSKKITFMLDEGLIKTIDDSFQIDDRIINKALERYLQDDNNNQSGYNAEIQTKMRMLELDKQKIEQEKNQLEIDFACLKQQKHHLESRIDDLTELYPSASVLLGKKPVADYNKIRLLKNRILKRK